ncbi:outer membrane protein assembly factor BamB family protein [Natronococcus wangiae]|uniref:outer membrane protein assembly factor BamB family protein n=1 Tax=Natronococcus wangiae TaxID=3068275 RepID=UPI00273F96B3|nr:PQQ-binding-like beta-propeller repeat protein [Natronococcus sp. AD5]
MALAAGGTVGAVGAAAETNGEQPEPVAERPGWSSYRGNAGNAGAVATDEFPEPDDLAWVYEESGALAAVNGTVYLRTDAGELHALDAQDGALEWKRTALTLTEVPFEPQGTPAVADGTVYVTGNQLTALDAATGEVEWRVTFDGAASMASPTVAYETVYVVADGSLCAVDAVDGSIVWERDTVGVEAVRPADVPGGRKEITENRAFRPTPVAVARETVYACTEAAPNEDLDDVSEFAAVVALDALTGDRRWTHDFGHQTRSVGDWGPAVTGEVLYVGSGLGGVDNDFAGGLDLASGDGSRGSWSVHPVASNDEYRVTTGEYSVTVSDLERDGSGWNEGYVGSAVTFPFSDQLIVGETVIVAHNASAEIVEQMRTRSEREYEPYSVLGFDIEDGTEKWAVSFDDLGGLETLLADETTLYIANDEGLFALRSARADAVERDDEERTDETDDAEQGDDGRDDSDTGDTETTEGDGGGESDEDEGAAGDTDESDGDDVDEAAGSADTGTDDADKSEAPADDEDATDQEPGEAADDADAAVDITADSVPGFTTGAGLVGGALSLEWLRRRAADDPEA